MRSTWASNGLDCASKNQGRERSFVCEYSQCSSDQILSEVNDTERAPRGKLSCKWSWSSKAEFHNQYVLSVLHICLMVELLNPLGSWPWQGQLEPLSLSPLAKSSLIHSGGVCNMVIFSVHHDKGKFGELCYRVSLASEDLSHLEGNV